MPELFFSARDDDCPFAKVTFMDLTYEHGGWQRAGLTTVDWGKASVDDWVFKKSFNQAVSNADAIRFDVSSFQMNYPRPGLTVWELNQITSSPSLLQKTTFIQNGQIVTSNGAGFVP